MQGEWIFVSGRVQKEKGASSKGEKGFAYENCPVVEGLRRPERSAGRRRPSTTGQSGLILSCEKNNWPNASPAPFSNTSCNSLTTGTLTAQKLPNTSRSA